MIDKLKHLIAELYQFLHHKAEHLDNDITHWIHHGAHCTYLGAAVAEAHGIYSIAAGVLLCMVIVSAFAGE